MSELKDQIDTLMASWDRASEVANGAPASWQPYWPNSQLVLFDEMLEVLKFWVTRVRAPSGFSPGFHLAKTVAASAIPALISTAQQIEAGQYQALPTFANQIVGALSAIHSMVVYSDQDQATRGNADLAAHLSQGIALVQTAQSELADKNSLLARSDAIIAAIETQHQRVDQISTDSGVLEDEVVKFHEKVKEAAASIDELLVEATAREADIGKLVTAGTAVSGVLEDLKIQLSAAIEQTKKQSNLIDSLLPKGASVGLAAAFANRGAQLQYTKWIWMGAFVVSLGGLAYFANHLATTLPIDAKEFWPSFLSRMTLGVPLVWLGWFSAVQYGNVVRVQEDYAFKEATSKAFQGYRDHMEHLASVDLDTGGTALNLMAAKTIEILAQEPLRIYGKSSKDASPAHGMADILTTLKVKKPLGNAAIHEA
jgi:hypothetical protein